MIFGWLLVALLLVAGYGWAVRLLREQGWLALLLGLAISVGALTLIMLWQGLLGIPLTLSSITLFYIALMLPGWRQLKITLARLPAPWAKRLALLLLLIVSGAILFNGAYLPFHRPDALGIYQPAAQEIYHTGALVPLTGADSLYRTYPILVPLAYSYAYIASGWENEYLAKTIATLLSVACIPAAFVLGRQWRGARVGWLAALLLAFTPFFNRWAASGYVDLPMAFFYTLAAVFALRVWQSGSLRDAALAGGMIGLAAWTKNAGLIGVPVLALWLVWCVLNRKAHWHTLAVSLVVCALIAAPWYLRNLSGAGFLIPNTAWTEQAKHTLETALIFATHLHDFGVTGWLILLGVVAAIPRAIRRDPGTLLLLLWTVPFFAAWWLFVSYDPRFLLLFLPPLCVLASEPLERIWCRIGEAWKPRFRIALALCGLLLTGIMVMQAVEYKGDLLRNPLMSDAEKRALVGLE